MEKSRGVNDVHRTISMKLKRNVLDTRLGAVQSIFFLQKSEITMEVGGWVQVSLGICCC